MTLYVIISIVIIVNIAIVIIIGYASRRIKMIYPTGLDVRPEKRKNCLLA